LLLTVSALDSDAVHWGPLLKFLGERIWSILVQLAVLRECGHTKWICILIWPTRP
jgi:hypothetical protein